MYPYRRKTLMWSRDKKPRLALRFAWEIFPGSTRAVLVPLRKGQCAYVCVGSCRQP
jgi:hypothetical protein